MAKMQFTKDKLEDELSKKKSKAEEILKDEEKTERILNKAKGLLGKLIDQSTVDNFAEDIATTIELIRDYVKGNYRDIPIALVIAVMAGLLYFVSPIDLIPDFIPGIGFLDDIAILTLILVKGLSVELEEYRKWKTKTQKEEFS